MPTVEQYAASIVEKYHVDADTGSPSHHAADEVIPLVKEWGKQYLAGISLSGAYAKNTAVSLSSDVDLLVTLKPVPNMEMKQVFWNLFEFFTDHDCKPHTRNVSIQLKSRGLLVDLIPAYREADGSSQTLFNKKTGHAVRTDVGRHVHLMANSGRQQEICALKIWRERNSLDFPSLYLELTALHALETQRFGQVAENVLTTLRYMAHRITQAVVRDPANSTNIISDDISSSAKQAIAHAATEALYDENWKKILW
jgi:hypothetical protein